MLDPLPEQLARSGKLLMAVRQQRVVQAQDIRHVSGNASAAFAAAIVGPKRPRRPAVVALLLIGGEHAGVLQRLRQIPLLAAGLE